MRRLPAGVRGNQVLVASEARGEGRHRRTFEVLKQATPTVERQSAKASTLGAFTRWQDVGWKGLGEFAVRLAASNVDITP
jgi:hypothetical protein